MRIVYYKEPNRLSASVKYQNNSNSERGHGSIRKGDSKVKKSTKITLISIWLISGTSILTYIWGNNPDLFFKPPKSFANWLADIYGVKNA